MSDHKKSLNNITKIYNKCNKNIEEAANQLFETSSDEESKEED